MNAIATNEKKANLAENALRVYACGGASTSIASIAEHARKENIVGMAPLAAVYVDTSDSDLTPDIPREHVYLIPEAKDGSGGVKATNSEPIRLRTKELVQKHPPTETAVVVSSASGGTGPVIAGALTNELLGMGIDVIVISIGTTESDIRIKNTLGTLKMYEVLAQKHNRPVNLRYYENSAVTPPSEVDEEICSFLATLAIVFSRQNKSLDRSDLKSFLNYSAPVTKFPAHMSGIQVVEGVLDDTIPNADKIITVASIVKNLDNRGLNIRVPYACHGILPSNAPVEAGARLPLHLVTYAYPFNEIAASLNAELAAIERANSARPASTGVLSSAEASNASDIDFLMLD